MVDILIGLCYPSMVLGLSMMLEVISMPYYKLKNHNLTLNQKEKGSIMHQLRGLLNIMPRKVKCINEQSSKSVKLQVTIGCEPATFPYFQKRKPDRTLKSLNITRLNPKFYKQIIYSHQLAFSQFQ